MPIFSFANLNKEGGVAHHRYFVNLSPQHTYVAFFLLVGLYNTLTLLANRKFANMTTM
jgi:hypothetical protein